MACFLSHVSVAPNLSTDYKHVTFHKLHHLSPKICRINCSGSNNENPTTTTTTTTTTTSNNSSVAAQKKDGGEPENVVLKVAWYASEMLGIAASALRSPPSDNIDRCPELPCDETGAVDRSAVVETIKQDFERSYFVTGNLTLGAYEEDCEFADPAGSFKGLRRFKRNCTNFGSLLKKSNMKLMKWEDFEDKGIGHWRFSCILSFPWWPILSATGYTEYYFDPQSGKVCSPKRRELLGLNIGRGIEKFLDDQFTQLQKLADESTPDFVYEVVTLFFQDSEKLIDSLAKALEHPVVDFNQFLVAASVGSYGAYL